MDGWARENWAGWFLALEVSEVEVSVEAPREKEPGGQSAAWDSCVLGDICPALCINTEASIVLFHRDFGLSVAAPCLC